MILGPKPDILFGIGVAPFFGSSPKNGGTGSNATLLHTGICFKFELLYSVIPVPVLISYHQYFMKQPGKEKN